MKWEFNELVNKYINPPVPTLDYMSNLTFWENTNNLRDGIKAYKKLLYVCDALGVELNNIKTHPMVGERF